MPQTFNWSFGLVARTITQPWKSCAEKFAGGKESTIKFWRILIASFKLKLIELNFYLNISTSVEKLSLKIIVKNVKFKCHLAEK